jgi:HlyD family secretion protein
MNEATTMLWREPELSDGDTSLLPIPPVRRRRRWPWLVLASLVVAGGALGVTLWRHGAGPRTTYETATATRGRIVVTVTASATVSALKTVQVGSQVSGRIAELHADFNDTVARGELLARIDPQLFQAAVEQAQASFSVARANVAKAEAQLLDAERQQARSKTLGDARFLAQQDVDTAASAADVARAQLLAARAQRQQAAASLHQAELNLSMTAIRSPIDGVVVSRSVDVGQTVAASLAAPTIFTLAEDLRKMQLEAHVGEGDVARLAPDLTVTFTVDAFPGRKFSGRLRQVRNAAATVQNVVTYDAIVDVDNPGLELRPGMTATVSFIIADKGDVVRIPNAALRFRPPRPSVPRAGRPAGAEPGAGRPPADRKLVHVLEGAAMRPVPVRTGVSDGSYTELVEGDLREGMALVTDVDDGSTTRQPGASAPGAIGPGGGMGIPGMGGGRTPGAGRR